MKSIFQTCAVLLSFGWAETALACAVCFGDPNSNMVKGASAGIFVLLGVIVSVLLSIVAVTLVWVRRARAIRRKGPAVEGKRGFRVDFSGV